MRQVLCPRLIGRGEAIRTLSGALDELPDHGRMIWLTGEPGVGKSRLVRECTTLVHDRGRLVLQGRAVESGGTTPYRPLAEALLSGLRTTGLPDSDTLEPFRPALGRLIPQWRSVTEPGLDEPPYMVGEAIIRLLRTVGSLGCLLVLEDLHWADPETLGVVEYLADNLAAEPVTCIATTRTDHSAPAMAFARSAATRRTGTVIELERMPDEDVDSMAVACLGEGLPAELLEALRSWAEGLPFLVEEVLATLVSSGALERSANGWTARSLDRILPESFAGDVRHRVELLGDDARRILRAAALLGRRFEWSLLPRISGLDESVVLTSLRQAVDAQLLTAHSDIGHSGFWFRHALTRDAVRADMLPHERREMSAVALGILQADHPGLPGEWCPLAADLAAGSGDHSLAATLLLESARRAIADGALATAEASLEQAAHLLSNTEDGLALDISECLVEVLGLAGRSDRVFQVGEELLGRLTRTDAPAARRAEVHLRLSRAAVARSRWGDARTNIELAAELASRSNDDTLAPRIDALRAHVAMGEARPDEAMALARTAVVEAERIQLPEVACEALEVVGRCARLRDLDQAEHAFQRSLEIAEREGLGVWKIRALHELGTIDLLGKVSAVRLEEAHRQATAAGALATAATLDLQIASCHLTGHRADQALVAIDRSVEISRRFGLDHVYGSALIFRGWTLALRGDRPSMERVLDEMPDPIPTADAAGGIWGVCRGTCSLVLEDHARAMDELERSDEILARSPTTSPHATRGLWALLRIVDGTDGEAACAQIRASPAFVNTIVRGALSQAEAVLHGRAGRLSEADRSASRAEAELSPGPWFLHIGHRLIAQEAFDRGWGEPERWLREAAAFFDEQRQDRVASACRSLLRKAGVRMSRRGRGDSAVPEELAAQGVTSREMDVLALVREGLSNVEIGERLFLSPRTVETHVSSLLRKSGAANRLQLVAWGPRTT